MEKVIIGIDHGYGLIKTANSDFITSLATYDYAPPVSQMSLKLGNKYYVAGGPQRLAVKEEKSKDEDNYILTLIAIAKELKYRGNIREAEVIISAGLPLTRYGLERDNFKSYLMRNKEVSYEFEGEKYHIIINNVILNPQGYAAVVEDINTESFPDDVVIVDIGSWTIDILPFYNKVPDQQRCQSISGGVITLMNQINEELRRHLGKDVTENKIQEVMLKKSSISEDYKNIIEAKIREYCENLAKKMQEYGFNNDVTPFIFAGGGTSCIRNFGMDLFKNARIKSDIHANAKGYEYIANALISAM